MAANGGSVAIAVDGASSVELGGGQTDMLPALNAMCAPSQLGDPITALNIGMSQPSLNAVVSSLSI
jgi:hypothetical protein